MICYLLSLFDTNDVIFVSKYEKNNDYYINFYGFNILHFLTEIITS
jgi:hypothetical protein